MRKVLSLAAVVCLYGTDTHALSLDWANQEQTAIVGQIGTAMANANVCGFAVDGDGMTQVIRSKIAPVGKLTPEMASALVFSVVGMQAMNEQLLGISGMTKRERAAHCLTVLKNFGPQGSSVRGLLKP